MKRISLLVGWCFKSGQPQRIISGLKETFIKRYAVERTNKAEIRPEEQSEKPENTKAIKTKIGTSPPSLSVCKSSHLNHT